MSTVNAAAGEATKPSGKAAGNPPAVRRQFVNFVLYKLAPEFRRLPMEQRARAREELVGAISQKREGLICLAYSTVGLRADADFLLWRIAYDAGEFAAQTGMINKTVLGGYLAAAHSLLSMTKRSTYIDKLDPFHTSESRSLIVPGGAKFLFVYPFVKTREWYLLPSERRQQIMDEHIRVGNKYPSVKLNTTYSFGLDDQDFVVAFETDEPKDFLDLVMELRETESSRYTKRDTPIFSCVRAGIGEILDQMF